MRSRRHEFVAIVVAVTLAGVIAIRAPEVFPLGVITESQAIATGNAQFARECPGCPGSLAHAELLSCPQFADRATRCWQRTGWFWLLSYSNGAVVWVDGHSGAADLVPPSFGGT